MSFTAEAAPKRSPASPGSAYVRLDTWSRANEFTLRWLRPEKILQLSHGERRLVFTVNSAQAEINGVNVWLCSPIVHSSGSVRITQRDLSQSIVPLLHPPRQAPASKITTICLDPGHGGSDPGFRTGSHEEQKYTLRLAYEIREQLKSHGFKIVLTRSADKYVDLGTRTAVARRHKADLFVSLHFNSTETSKNQVRGVETYCVTPAGAYSTNARGQGDTGWVSGNEYGARSFLLAYEVQKAMVTQLSAEDRGVRRARFQVLREATMPAILVEGGFLSHPVEGKKIVDPAYRRQLARAIVSGIAAYKKAVNG